MNTADFVRLKNQLRQHLVDDTIPFWLRSSVDREFGGFLTFLDRQGNPLDTDKGVWMQGREIWLFAKLYNELEKRAEWLETAEHGARFLLNHCFDDDGKVRFSVTRDGRHLRTRQYIAADVFAVMGLAELARATGNRQYLDRAKEVARNIERLVNTPGLLRPKVDPATRQTRAHSPAMIRINLYQTLRSADPDGEYDSIIDGAIDEVFHYFVRPEKEALYETVGADGELMDSPAGRCINPGHSLETAWFILEEGRRRNDRELIQRALPIVKWSFERGWDDEHGGIFYFVDVEGRQAEALEWDMKLWWVHNEAIYALLLAYHLTNDDWFLRKFELTFDWATSRFPDKEYGEWFGYLHRDGSVALTYKANNWKGPFHLPRQELYSVLLLESMVSERDNTNNEG